MNTQPTFPAPASRGTPLPLKGVNQPVERGTLAYTYEHVDFDDHSWICTEDFIGETWGPFGLRETDDGWLATTLPSLGASRAISIIIDKPLCGGCNGMIVDMVCHDCEVVFHRELHGWELAEASLRSSYAMGAAK